MEEGGNSSLGNFVREPAKRWWLLGLMSILATVALFPLDVTFWRLLSGIPPSYLKAQVGWFSKFGVYAFYLVFSGLYVYCWVRRKLELRRLAISYLKAQLIFSLLVVRCGKIFFGRARPVHGSGFTFFSLDSDYNSFPSGHAADAFVSGIFLYHVLRGSRYSRYRFLPLIYSGLIALSRVVVSAHYPSDVVAGTAVGIFGAWFFLSRLPERGGNGATPLETSL